MKEIKMQKDINKEGLPSTEKGSIFLFACMEK